MEKIDKNHYYMEIAKSVAIKCNCLCIAYGCLIVRDDQIIATGYVGSPRKTKDCIDLGYCVRRRKNVPSGTGYEMCRSVHAEMNAVINAARSGVSVLGGTMYLYTARRDESGLVPVKAYPCLLCKKIIINAGIDTFIGNSAQGEILRYPVESWVLGWQELEDITADEEKYCVDYVSKTKDDQS